MPYALLLLSVSLSLSLSLSRLDTLFKMLLLAVFLYAFYVEREKPFYLNPAVGWALWGAVWMFWLGTPKKCCLPWLSNGENC
jgi:hypothetical protein